MIRLLLVGLGGAAGSMLRYALQIWLNESHFPYGTFLVNIAGCLLIGLLAGLAQKNGLTSEMTALLMSGFCGGFTTFSAFSLESLQLMKDQIFTFVLYTFGTLLLSLMFTFIGYKITTAA